jgi:putative aldouronate transport system permease protein
MIPGIAYFIIFKYIPIYGVTLAFKDYKIPLGIMASPWAGLVHFNRMFSGTTFWTIVRNTVVLNIYRLIFGFPMPIILALVINELKNMRYKKIVQTITYMPHFVSWIVIYGLFAQLLSPSTGPVNLIIKALGFKQIYFLGDPSYFRFTMVMTSIWKGAGWGSIIYLAALSGIDPELYEAATIEGATRLQRIIYITLPSIKSIIVLMLILRMGDLMDDNFEQIYNFLNDNTLSVGDVISTYVYRTGITKMQYSMGTAVELFTTVLNLVLVLTSNYIANKAGEEGIW